MEQKATKSSKRQDITEYRRQELEIRGYPPQHLLKASSGLGGKQLSFWLLIGFLLLLGVFLPRLALADPHAIFYTDRAQAQLFYNVLAALNQADYVEPPGTPPIQADKRLGDFIREGIYEAPNQPRRVTLVGNRLVMTPPLEPAEAQDVELPRIRVRQVTSDNGDVYYRERLERRALEEERRQMINYLACRDLRLVFGDEDVDPNDKYCPFPAQGENKVWFPDPYD